MKVSETTLQSMDILQSPILHPESIEFSHHARDLYSGTRIASHCQFRQKTDVSVSIVPDGAISGRVVDWDGFPVVGIQVQALTFFPDGRGRRVLFVIGSDE